MADRRVKPSRVGRGSPLKMQGGTTFAFVTDGIQAALEQARKAAGGKDISLAGGAKACAQYLKAGLVHTEPTGGAVKRLTIRARSRGNADAARLRLRRQRPRRFSDTFA